MEQKTSLQLELESLQQNKTAFEQSIDRLQGDHRTAPETLQRERRNLAEISARMNELEKVQDSSKPRASSGIPSVR